MGWQGGLTPCVATPGAHNPKLILSLSRCCSEGGITAERKVLRLFLSLCGGICTARPPISAGAAQGTMVSRLILSLQSQPRGCDVGHGFYVAAETRRSMFFLSF